MAFDLIRRGERAGIKQECHLGPGRYGEDYATLSPHHGSSATDSEWIFADEG